MIYDDDIGQTSPQNGTDGVRLFGISSYNDLGRDFFVFLKSDRQATHLHGCVTIAAVLDKKTQKHISVYTFPF